MNTEQINPSGPNHFASSNSPGASLASSASKSTEATQTISGSHQLCPEPIPLLQENIPAVKVQTLESVKEVATEFVTVALHLIL